MPGPEFKCHVCLGTLAFAAKLDLTLPDGLQERRVLACCNCGTIWMPKDPIEDRVWAKSWGLTPAGDRAMPRPDPNEVLAEQIRAQSIQRGLTEEEASAFLLWIANEVFEGREVGNFAVLLARTPELVKIYRAQKSVETS